MAGTVIFSLKVLNFGCEVGRAALIEDVEAGSFNADWGKDFKKDMKVPEMLEYFKFRDDHKKKECLTYLKERNYID